MYKVYIMYMAKHYILSDFRKSTREAFNLVDLGEVVTIERYGEYYELTPSYGEAYDVPPVKAELKESPDQTRRVPQKIVDSFNRNNSFQCQKCGMMKVAGKCITKGCKG